MAPRASSFCLALSFAGSLAGAVTPNNRPIIGILTQPLNVELLSDDHGLGSTQDNRSYIAASYVKFAESSGARVVPMHFEASNEELAKLFHSVNGLLLPGGGAEIRKLPNNRFREAAEFLYDLAIKANDAGDAFPIHGTCMGFQMLTVMAAQDDGVLCAGCYDTEGTPLPLEFTSAAKTSKLFSGLDSKLRTALATQNITENSHTSGVEPKKYESVPRLKKFFEVLSTNSDSQGVPFVSTIEAKHYPITASQWHPEKNNFEWGKIGKLGYEAIPHSEAAVLLSQYMANNFVNRAKLNSHRFSSSEAETEALIYNHAPVADPQGYFSQIYLWGQKQSTTVIV
jgi:gamma-glutamyl hydrolase